MKRAVVVSVRASLEDLCLRKAKANWSPSPEAISAIFKQQKFVDLKGTSEKQGDLKVSFSALAATALEEAPCLTRLTRFVDSRW